MLIYVNQIKVNGSNALDSTLKTVAGWLKELTKRHFTPEELKISEDYIIGRQKLEPTTLPKRNPFFIPYCFLTQTPMFMVANGLQKLVSG
ncbi:hypothetical protein TUM17387_10420 [Shewanella carassii]|nr:hypothetical protein TUM17387_10420 [Shewanella carassii]